VRELERDRDRGREDLPVVDAERQSAVSKRERGRENSSRERVKKYRSVRDI
jgi:hypothetical protein